MIGVVTRPLLTDSKIKVDVVMNRVRKAIIKNGGVPIGILPVQNIDYDGDVPKLTDLDKEKIIEQLKLCDGIVMQGGTRWYDYDEFIAKYAIENDIPTLFICMSMQLLGFINGCELKETSNHFSEEDYAHEVDIRKGLLYKILNKDKIKVNSMHNYMITNIKNVNIDAVSNDTVEAISLPDKKFILGVQWHPEKMVDFDEDSNKIFKYFIDITKDN